MKTYRVTISGLSPLLMHSDNLEWAGKLKLWREIPENKKLSVAGDDRSPAFSWLGSLYHDGSVVGMPSDSLMRCLMEGGAQVVVPGGRNGKTFKAQTQSGMLVVDESWPLLVMGKAIKVAPILKLATVNDFEVHAKAALDAGFRLFVKRAKIGQSKHVRVRPRFDSWSTTGLLQVWDEQLTLPVLRDIVRLSGELKGLGDWRPSSRTPGPFGRFSAEVQEVKSS
jgi:hypothetical protein